MKIFRTNLVLILAALLAVTAKASEDEGSCSAKGKEDGECGESEEDISTSFWKIGETGFNKDELQSHLKNLGEQMNSLELEIVMSFLDGNKDRLISESEFEKVLKQRPDLIVHGVFDSFNIFDGDNDGLITMDELQKQVEESVDTEDLLLISLDLDELSEGKVAMLDFIKPLIRLGKNVEKVLAPFQQLDHLKALDIKNTMQASLKMFGEIDADSDGIISKNEHLTAMNRPLPNGKTLTEEQKLTIFVGLDIDKDDEISYYEFQVVMPQKPKDLKENLNKIFLDADEDKDDFVTENELRKHLTKQSQLLKIPPPSDNEIDDTFSKLDLDDDGKLSFDEMSALIDEFKQIQKTKYAEAFNALDKDGDGELSKEEMLEVARIMGERAGQEIDPEMLTKMLDRNEDGVVTFAELQTLISKFQHQQE